MLNKWDLQREVGSLEMLISALSSDLVKTKNGNAQNIRESVLLKEMEEALQELRQARGMTKVLLLALASQSGNKTPASGKKVRHRIFH